MTARLTAVGGALSKSTYRRRRLTVLAGVAVAIAVALLATEALGGHPDAAPGIPRDAVQVDIGSVPVGRAIPPGFVGFSLEYFSLFAYAGHNPAAINPTFIHLLTAVTPGARPVLRFGGDSTDWTWWPVPHMRQPLGVSYTITKRWVAVTRALATALGARLILGIDLEADSAPLAAAEARALSDGIGTRAISALEPGNEPELYRSWSWYCSSAGRPITGRPSSYGFPAFVQDFSNITKAIPTDLPLAGPTVGIHTWFPDLPQFLVADPRVRVVTLHRYPLQNFVSPASPVYPSVSNLLSDGASRGLADSIAPDVRIAHAHHLPLRIDEMNSVSAGQAPGVANSFASALWIVDALFNMARVGVDGVNIHTFPSATYELFHFRRTQDRWQGFVSPEYYGLLMFAQAAPLGSRLLRSFTATGGAVKAWATYTRDRTIRVVLINDHSHAQTVVLQATGHTAPAALERLVAPNIHSVTGVTLGGQTFGPQTATGVLAGQPTHIAVPPANHRYVVSLPPTSAAMLTIH
ncbi:MAG TPA: glycosyl hydrolase family 79 C-terminal domain-containing protein [Candidatus Dormibacteraeota bacterium]